MLTVSAFYHFTPLSDPASLRGPLVDLCRSVGVKGTLILAGEGINGTIAGTATGVAVVMAHLRALPGCGGLMAKDSLAAHMPFGRIKVRIKAEIVTMGQPDIDPLAAVGTYVDPVHWNALIAAPDVALIDTRNGYEVGIGTFQGATDPETASFREFPGWWQQNAARFAGKRVAMFCTGGIRCEKATSYLKSQGADQVFHLRGGILKYLEEVPPDQSMWQGQCFVFDQRVSVGHGLQPGGLETCHACRRPLLDGDLTHPAYEPGVCCAQCVDEYSAEDRARFRQRHHQMMLARDRGTRHLGQEY